jgi:hypothetical protein
MRMVARNSALTFLYYVFGAHYPMRITHLGYPLIDRSTEIFQLPWLSSQGKNAVYILHFIPGHVLRAKVPRL